MRERDTTNVDSLSVHPEPEVAKSFADVQASAKTVGLAINLETLGAFFEASSKIRAARRMAAAQPPKHTSESAGM